eukprot:SAG11_NODE_15_length_26319_cov_13.810564_1_plen_541_part_00
MSVFDKLTDASNYTGTTRQRHGMQAKGGRRTKNRRPITPLHKGRSEPQLSVKTDSRSPGRSRAESASVESTSYRPAGLVGGAFDTANVPFSGEDQRHAHVDEAVTRIYDSIHSREDALWLFRRMDRDNSGTLDVRELQKALNVHIGVKMDLPRCQMVLEALDTDADGRITVDDFLFGHKLARLGLVRQKFRATSYAVGRQDWGKLFRRYDRDNSGVLEFEEFRRAIRKDAKLARGEVSDDELLELFEFIDSDNNGSIDLDEFAKMLSIEPATPRRRGKVEGDSDIVEFTLQRICAELDRTMGTAQHMFHIADADGSGYLDASELDMVLRRRVGLQLTRKELQQLIAALDRDGNGNVSIQEFVMRLRKVRRENAAPIPYDKPKSPPPRKIAQNTDMEKLTQQLTVEQMTRMLMGGSDIKATKLAEYSWCVHSSSFYGPLPLAFAWRFSLLPPLTLHLNPASTGVLGRHSVSSPRVVVWYLLLVPWRRSMILRRRTLGERRQSNGLRRCVPKHGREITLELAKRTRRPGRPPNPRLESAAGR